MYIKNATFSQLYKMHGNEKKRVTVVLWNEWYTFHLFYAFTFPDQHDAIILIEIIIFIIITG